MKTGHNTLSGLSYPNNIEYGHGLDIPAPHPFPQESAEDMLQGKIMGIQLPHPLPWDRCPSGILEWTHFLNRHHFLRNVTLSLLKTGDNRYAAYLDETICGWIVSHPVPVHSNGGAGPSWETLSAAWRLREWLRVKTIAWPHPAFRRETKDLMLRSFWEHARHLMDHQGHPNNWIIVESAALVLAGMCLPDFLEAPTWIETGIRRLEHAMIHQFMDDGAHFEFSPLYQAICVEACLNVKIMAASLNIALPDVFDAPLENAAFYLSALHRPDFTWPAFNDAGSTAGDYTALMRMAGEIFQRKDFTWIGTRGNSGTPPTETMQVFPDAGIGIMRSGYDAQAHYLAFRAGSAGMTHIHEDALSIDIAANGTSCMVDPGITGYAPGPKTDHYRSTHAHNSLLIDGRGPLRSRLPYAERIQSARCNFSWFRQDNIEGMTGICCDYRDASGQIIQITRSIRFFSRSYWEIQDTVSGTGEHTLTTCWQFFPGNIDIDPHTSTIRFVNREGRGIVLIPDTGDHCCEILSCIGNPDPPCGWVSVDGKDMPAWNVRFSVRARLPVSCAWKIYPDPGIGSRTGPGSVPVIYEHIPFAIVKNRLV
jgi:hypothetical protein